MKKEFSTAWKASKQPRKQRKYRANAPLHLKKKFVSVNLSKELRKSEGKRNIQIKKGDKVKVMKGKYKGKRGKVLEVNLKFSKIYIDGIQVTKMDNSKANVKFQPSNLQIVEMTDRFNRKAKKKEDSKKDAKEKKVAPLPTGMTSKNGGLGVPQSHELGGKDKPREKAQ